jgi:hypothetical protein
MLFAALLLAAAQPAPPPADAQAAWKAFVTGRAKAAPASPRVKELERIVRLLPGDERRGNLGGPTGM